MPVTTHSSVQGRSIIPKLLFIRGEEINLLNRRGNYSSYSKGCVCLSCLFADQAVTVARCFTSRQTIIQLISQPISCADRAGRVVKLSRSFLCVIASDSDIVLQEAWYRTVIRCCDAGTRTSGRTRFVVSLTNIPLQCHTLEYKRRVQENYLVVRNID
jgi:hypothetical protein